MIRNKKGSEWTISQIGTIILVILVIVLVILGFATGLFNPAIDKVKAVYNSVIVYFYGEGDSIKWNAIILGKPRELSFDESRGFCIVNLNESGKYAIKWDDNSNQYKLYYFDAKWFQDLGGQKYERGTNTWIDVDEQIPSDEQVNLREIKESLNQARNWAHLPFPFEGKATTYQIELDSTVGLFVDLTDHPNYNGIYAFGFSNGAMWKGEKVADISNNGYRDIKWTELSSTDKTQKLINLQNLVFLKYQVSVPVVNKTDGFFHVIRDSSPERGKLSLMDIQSISLVDSAGKDVSIRYYLGNKDGTSSDSYYILYAFIDGKYYGIDDRFNLLASDSANKKWTLYKDPDNYPISYTFQTQEGEENEGLYQIDWGTAALRNNLKPELINACEEK